MFFILTAQKKKYYFSFILILCVFFCSTEINSIPSNSNVISNELISITDNISKEYNSFAKQNEKINAAQMVAELVKHTKEIKTLTLTNLFKERIDGVYETKKAFFKINVYPFKVYMKEEYPRNGLEVLFVEGLNNEKAWVRPNSFPWTTLSLSPTGSTMRNAQHHSIYKSGYSYLINVLEHLQNKYSSEIDELLVYNGLVKYNNIICHKISFTNPHFKYIPYKVGQNETLEDLSHKLMVNDYMVYELNPKNVGFENIKSGTILNIPSDYGSSMIIYIDEKTKLLAGVKVFDDKGLWEEYTYINVIPDPKFTILDFDVKNSAYNFY